MLYDGIMKIMSYSETRANFASALDAVIDDQEELVITRAGHEEVVMVPLREYESMRETLYLMRSPANRRHITEAIRQLEAGHGTRHELIEDDADTEVTSQQ